MPSRWKLINPTKQRAPQCPGVYAVYLNDELAYIGSTVNLFTRLRNGHGIDRHSSGKCYISRWGKYRKLRVKFRIADRYGDWLMRELRLIHRLYPRCNGPRWRIRSDWPRLILRFHRINSGKCPGYGAMLNRCPNPRSDWKDLDYRCDACVEANCQNDKWLRWRVPKEHPSFGRVTDEV